MTWGEKNKHGGVPGRDERDRASTVTTTKCGSPTHPSQRYRGHSKQLRDRGPPAAPSSCCLTLSPLPPPSPLPKGATRGPLRHRRPSQPHRSPPHTHNAQPRVHGHTTTHPTASKKKKDARSLARSIAVACARRQHRHAGSRTSPPNEHLDEVAGRAREEGHPGLRRHRPRQQGLSRPRWPGQEHAPGEPRANVGVPFFTQEKRKEDVRTHNAAEGGGGAWRFGGGAGGSIGGVRELFIAWFIGGVDLERCSASTCRLRVG